MENADGEHSFPKRKSGAVAELEENFRRDRSCKIKFLLERKMK
jgi:hypothetical protein